MALPVELVVKVTFVLMVTVSHLDPPEEEHCT